MAVYTYAAAEARTTLTSSVAPMASDLCYAGSAARLAGLLSTSAAVPRSFSLATLPIASRMAVSTPA